MENNKRIQLLSDTEVEDLYALPEFNAAEQSLYFTLSKSEQIALNRYNNVKIKIYFILQLGYFKAKRQFFNFSLEEVKKNTKYIIKEYRLKTDSKLIGRLSRDYLRAVSYTHLTLPTIY